MNKTKIKHFNPMKIKGTDTKTGNMFSSFWADNDWDTRRTDILGEDDKPKKRQVDHIQLASYRRAISNFVNIVTNRSDIPVTFQQAGDSYTDGKSVVIGSKINEKNFDSTVGLALHEGSHIKLSNFALLRNLDSSIPEELYRLGERKGRDRNQVFADVRNVLNYIEDRRIDYYVFKSSPGYKGYYHSMYDKYFHAKVIDMALESNEYTELDFDSYLFRLVNITNKNTNFNALPQLRDIYNIIFTGKTNVKTIDSTDEVLGLTLEVMDVIYKNLETPKPELQDNGGDEEQETGNGENGEGVSADGQTTISDEKLKEMLDNGQIQSGKGGNDGKGKSVELTERQKKMLEKAFDKQKDFIHGNPQKTGRLSKKDSRMVKTMEEAGVTLQDAGSDVAKDWYGNKTGKGTKVIFVKKLTRTMIEEGMFRGVLSKVNQIERGWYGDEDYVGDGIKIGTRLGRKLQIRGESRDTKWSRLDSGRIDKRLVAELGFGNNRVFQTTFTESYSDAILHISVDASGSMSGKKWTKTMTSVVAITKACSMIQNVDVVVSFRSTDDGGNYSTRRADTKPLIIIAYDSRVDNFNKVRRDFPHIHPGGTTPEGLCFEAIMDDFVPSTTDRDSYFLNFSDGMPMFSNNDMYYTSEEALTHTNKMVKKIRDMGIKVLSYFVEDRGYGDNIGDFKRMYGKDAEQINVTNVVEISKTMNKKFLEK